MNRWILTLTAAALLVASPVLAQLAPASMNVGVEERLGARLPTSVLVTDQNGVLRPLSDVAGDERPLVLTLGYFRCPAMCDATLSRLVDAVRAADLELGRDYRVVTMSFDPGDTPAAAAKKRASTVAHLGREIPPEAWTFAVAGELEAAALVRGAGVQLVRDPTTDQWAHPAVIVVLTPDGRVSRYLDGLDTSPRDLRLAVLEAGVGRVGSRLDRALLACYRFDPASRRYAADVLGLMRAGGALVGLSVAGVLAAFWRRERRRGGPETRR